MTSHADHTNNDVIIIMGVIIMMMVLDSAVKCVQKLTVARKNCSQIKGQRTVLRSETEQAGAQFSGAGCHWFI